MCRICAGQAADEFSMHGFRWIHCASCRSIQKSITEAEYRALNPKYDAGLYLDSRDRNEIEGYLGVEAKGALLRDVVEQHLDASQRGTFLDVGCGMGGYLL